MLESTILGVRCTRAVAPLSSKCETHKVLKGVIRFSGRLPGRIETQQRMIISEHEPQKDLRNDASPDRSQARSGDRHTLFNWNFNLLLILHGFGQNVSPQRTIVLKYRINRRDGHWLITGIRFIDALADKNVLVIERLHVHRPRYVLSRREPHPKTALQIMKRKGRRSVRHNLW